MRVFPRTHFREAGDTHLKGKLAINSFEWFHTPISLEIYPPRIQPQLQIIFVMSDGFRQKNNPDQYPMIIQILNARV